jgi:hypothetical protein
MGSTYLEHSSRRTIDIRQSIHRREDTVHHKRYVRTNGTIAVLSMAHQRPGREESQENHLCCDGLERRFVSGRCVSFHLSMPVSLIQYPFL